MNKMKMITCLGLLFVTTLSVSLSAHSVSETNSLVRAALRGVVRSWKDNFGAGNMIVLEDADIVDSWQGFLGRYGDEAWTIEGKIGAFDWYLDTLGTNDCVGMSVRDQNLVHAALVQCRELSYTNSVPYLRNYALNPRAIYRDSAIELVLDFSPVSDSLTSFVETMVTNDAEYGILDRSTACCRYARHLLSMKACERDSVSVVSNAVQMFYRNRGQDVVQTAIVDEVFTHMIDGYAMSSNRLEFALVALAANENHELERCRFSAITNQLISSGRPLCHLTIGEGE